MEKEQIVLSSTHVDSHGMMMTKEALENAAKTINSDRNPRIGLEHDMSFPPLGRITDASVVQGKDGAYYLVAYREYFDNRKETVLEDGTILYKESFEKGAKPFVEAKPEHKEIIEIHTDPENFENIESLNEFFKELKVESDIDFSKQMLLRKSIISDPELVIKLSSIIAISIGIIATKIPEKVGEAIGEDVAKFYKLLRTSVLGMVKRAIPKLRPITFIIEIHDDILIELLIVSNSPDEVVTAFSSDRINLIQEKVDTSKKIFGAEKIQFYYNDKNVWELNYMLTKDGSTIGTKKAFDRRDKAFQELVNKMIEQDNE
jgi:hypothetical protein